MKNLFHFSPCRHLTKSHMQNQSDYEIKDVEPSVKDALGIN